MRWCAENGHLHWCDANSACGQTVSVGVRVGVLRWALPGGGPLAPLLEDACSAPLLSGPMGLVCNCVRVGVQVGGISWSAHPPNLQFTMPSNHANIPTCQHAMPCQARPCHAMPGQAVPCHAMPCHANMPCHSMPPCHHATMPCYAMSCHVIVPPCHHTMPTFMGRVYTISWSGPCLAGRVRVISR